MDSKADPRALPSLWPYLALSAVLACWVDLGDYHRHNTSDSLVPVLTSSYKWTPYYWECNRIGMLVPLLAVPFQNPLNNLLVQGWLVLFAAFATFFLLARYTLRTPSWPLVGALAAGVFVVFSHLSFCFVATFGQPHYCVALALASGGLLLTEPRRGGGLAWRLPAALVLVLLAMWVNSAVPVIFAPLVVLRSLLRPRPAAEAGAVWAVRLRGWLRGAVDAEAMLSLGLLVVAVGAGLLGRLVVTVSHDPFNLGYLPASRWPAAWRTLAANTYHAAVTPHRLAFMSVAAVAGLLLLPQAVRRHAPGPLRAGLVLAAGGLAYGLAMGTTDWVAHNLFCFKYWIPVVFFMETALAVVALAPLAALLRPRLHKTLCWLCAPALVAAVAAQHGLPSRGRVRTTLDHMPHGVPLPQQTADVLATRATHLIGTYAEVWVSVFHANLVLYERGLDHRVWGVGGRCNPTWRLWGRMAPEDMRLAGLLDSPGGNPHGDVIAYLNDYFPPVVAVEKRPSLWLYRPADELPHTPTAGSGGTVLASWHHGFYGTGFFDNLGIAPDMGRWCGSSTGKLTLTNTADHPLRVTLSFQPRTGHTVPASLWIDSPLYHAQLPIHVAAAPQRVNLVVPPGKHLVCFSCDAPPTPHPYGLRPQYFFLGAVALTVEDSKPAVAAAP
jgi:hypothetical protein